MTQLAIVAIVAMFLAFLITPPSLVVSPAEVILSIERPVIGFPLPERNPHR